MSSQSKSSLVSLSDLSYCFVKDRFFLGDHKFFLEFNFPVNGDFWNLWHASIEKSPLNLLTEGSGQQIISIHIKLVNFNEARFQTLFPGHSIENGEVNLDTIIKAHRSEWSVFRQKVKTLFNNQQLEYLGLIAKSAVKRVVKQKFGHDEKFMDSVSRVHFHPRGKRVYV